MTIQDTPVPADTGSESLLLLQNGKINFTPKLPAHDTLHALTLAVMLKGYEVCQRTMQSAPAHGTRCAAYVEHLEVNFKFQGCIDWRQLPYDEGQLKRRNKKHFHAYCLKPESISQLGKQGQRFADHVLTFFEIDLNHFRKAQPSRREADND